ncbi:mediator of RNA polymerase II transcription subunit 29 [Chrysoperla carnea]|uniref:mediator of RNA polymerase II transcription subunit 29 n=1 Tax=Chrysoperla carnea TaxID=189513 RepID=UPI001D0985A8|nr:mediator of RNA polymerase II transcription subunit 29 [Chrysoperla carnea]
MMNMHAMPQQPPQNTQPNQPPQQQLSQHLDNITKVRSLIGPLRDGLSATLKTAAQTLQQNSLIDTGSQKGVDLPLPRFDKNLEEFYSVCDQIELHLKTSIKCISQQASAQRYLPLAVSVTRTDALGTPDGSGTLTYPQFLATANAQVAFAKEVHDTLVAAAQNISPTE